MFGDSYLVKSIWIKIISFISNILLLPLSHMHLSVPFLDCRNKHVYHQKQRCFQVLQCLSHTDVDSIRGKKHGSMQASSGLQFPHRETWTHFPEGNCNIFQKILHLLSSQSVNCLISTMMYTMICLLDTVPVHSSWTIFYPFLSNQI